MKKMKEMIINEGDVIIIEGDKKEIDKIIREGKIKI